MKLRIFMALLLKIVPAVAQPMPHGMVYGTKPNLLGLLPTTKLETVMGKRTRISVTISGKVNRVIKAKGGWFVLDAGNGREIDAHFINYDITLPEKLKGHNVIAEGIAQKQFAAAGVQHFAAGKSASRRQDAGKTTPKLTLEVKGLMVD